MPFKMLVKKAFVLPITSLLVFLSSIYSHAMDEQQVESPGISSSQQVSQIQRLPSDCLQNVFQRCSGRDYLAFSLTCKKFHTLRSNIEFVDSLIKIPNLKKIMISESIDATKRSGALIEALDFQYNIGHLENALTIDINEKNRGEVFITCKLSPEEIYNILCNLPKEKISKLSPEYKWLHWIAHAPLMATLRHPSYDEQKALNFGRLLGTTPREFSPRELYNEWHNRLRTFCLKHSKSGFLWALSHQISGFKYIVEFPSNDQKGSPQLVKEIKELYLSDNVPNMKNIHKCYQNAVQDKIPTSEVELIIFESKSKSKRI